MCDVNQWCAVIECHHGVDSLFRLCGERLKYQRHMSTSRQGKVNKISKKLHVGRERKKREREEIERDVVGTRAVGKPLKLTFLRLAPLSLLMKVILIDFHSLAQYA